MQTSGSLYMILLLVVLLGCSAFFSGSETALMAISKIRLRHLADSMPKRAHLVETLLKKPERLIGTILLGNNLVNVAMSAIATALALSIWGEKGIIYVTGILTLIILMFAEITPKVYAKYFNERVSFHVAPLLNVFVLVLSPIVSAITFLTNKMLLFIGFDVSMAKRVLFTEAEVKTCIDMASDHGTITPSEKRMLSRVFTLNDKTVGQVMVPKEHMTVIDINESIESIRKKMLKTGYSRFPVVNSVKTEIIGMIYTKDFLHVVVREKKASLHKILRSAYFISIDKPIDVQLKSFQSKRVHQAIVLNEDGKPAGLITLEDILEELVGSIKDEHDFD
ncbi:MAG: DUF21 domain-containing protein [Deltaproteobacteria bacterium]|nr:DUF21 domain-containing protein [Deltaproteobacteria bacterium]